MQINMQQVRQQYPQYKDMSDQQLADALHNKYYSDMPKQDFYNKIGYSKDLISPQTTGMFGQQLIPEIQQDKANFINWFETPHKDLAKASLGTAAAIPVEAVTSGLATPLVARLGGGLLFRGLSGLASSTAGGAASGLVQGDPLKGAEYGAALSPVGSIASKAISKVPSILGSTSAIGKSILDFLHEQPPGTSLSPEEAEQAFNEKYYNQPNIDLGTLTANPHLAQRFKSMPTWGSDINPANIATQTKNRSLDNQINDLKNAQFHLGFDPNIETKIPAQINSLKSISGSPRALQSSIKNNTYDAYKKASQEANQNFSPLMRDDISLVGSDGKANLPNFKSKLLDNLVDEENLKNSYKTSPDNNDEFGMESNSNYMLPILNRVLNKSKGIVGLKTSPSGEIISQTEKPYDLSLKDAMSHLQEMSKLEQGAKSTGDKYQGSSIGELRKSFLDDVKNHLISTGNQNLADQIDLANSHYHTQVAPFFKFNNIRRAIGESSGETPVGYKLHQELLNPNASAVFNRLPESTKNDVIYKVITGGKGTADENILNSAKELGSRYKNIPSDYKESIKLANPEINQNLEETPQILENNKTYGKLDDQINKLIDQKRTITTPSSTSQAVSIPGKHDFFAALINPDRRYGLLGANPIYARSYLNAMTSPELRDAYLYNRPLSQDILTRNLPMINKLGRFGKYAVINNALNQENQ